MRRVMTAIVLASAVLLAACSTTSTVQQPRSTSSAGTVGEKYRYTFVNEAGAESEGTGDLDAAIRTRMQAAGVLAGDGAPATPVEIAVTQYRMRSGGARFWAGAMAGRDIIRSRVRVGDGGGDGSFEVETSNITAWGTTGGLLEKHADEIIARLQGG